MKSLMHILSVTLQILGSISAMGLVWLMKSAYYARITTVVSGRVVEWVNEAVEEGRAPRYRARLAYRDRQGNEQLVLSTETNYDTDLPNYPLEQPAKISYVTQQSDWAQLADGFAFRWGVPLVMLVIAVLCFTLATKLGR
jgi:hypothetical protein